MRIFFSHLFLVPVNKGFTLTPKRFPPLNCFYFSFILSYPMNPIEQFISVNRVLNKLTKWKHSRIMVSLVYLENKFYYHPPCAAKVSSLNRTIYFYLFYFVRLFRVKKHKFVYFIDTSIKMFSLLSSGFFHFLLNFFLFLDTVCVS